MRTKGTRFSISNLIKRLISLVSYVDLALLISQLELGQDEMPFEDYLIMEDEDIMGAQYCMLVLVDVAFG